MKKGLGQKEAPRWKKLQVQGELFNYTVISQKITINISIWPLTAWGEMGKKC